VNIAIIGTGVMGIGVGQALIGKGHTVRCYNRTPENAAALVQAGAVLCSTSQEAAQGASHVIILVWDEAALHAVLQGPDGLLANARPGQVFIDMSTQLPQTAKDCALAFADKGALFLDAPVHGSRAEAHSGGLWIMCGAEPAAWTAALPVLNTIGATVHHMGAVGAGCVAKLCGNHLVSAILASLAESLAVAKKSGLDCAELIKLWASQTSAHPLLKARATP